MTTVAPQPFPPAQADHYYIPQYHSCTPYARPPQQYSLQPSGSGTFYPGPESGHYPAPYHPLWYHSPDSPSVPATVATAGLPYYPGRAMFPISCPMVVPTPQQAPPAKRERKIIRIRDPGQGGRDVTEEVLAWGSWSRSSTPPVGSPSSTPSPPQKLSSSQTPEQQQQWQPPHHPHQVHPVGDTWEPPQAQQQSVTAGASDSKPEPAANERERLPLREATASPSPSGEDRKPSSMLLHPPNTDEALSGGPQTLASSPAPASMTSIGLADAPAHQPSPPSPSSLHCQPSAAVHRDASSSQTSVRPGMLVAARLTPAAPVAVVSVPPTLRPARARPDMISPGLPPLVWATREAYRLSRSIHAKDCDTRTRPEEHGGVTDDLAESQHPPLTTESPTEVNQKTSVLPKSRRRRKYKRKANQTSCSPESKVSYVIS